MNILKIVWEKLFMEKTIKEVPYSAAKFFVDSLKSDIDFIKIFPIERSTILGITRIYRNPDETAEFYIVTDKEIGKPFHRKIYSDKIGKYLKLDGSKYYLKINSKED